MTETQNPQNLNLQHGDYPDYGVWTRAVERVVNALDLDYWPDEELVAEIVAEFGLTDPDLGNQMQTLEDELIADFGN